MTMYTSMEWFPFLFSGFIIPVKNISLSFLSVFHFAKQRYSTAVHLKYRVVIDKRAETFPSDIRRNRGMMIPNSARVVILAVKSRQWARAGLFQVKKNFCGEYFYGFQNLGQQSDVSSRTFMLFAWVNCSKVAGLFCLGFFAVSYAKTSPAPRVLVSGENTQICLALFVKTCTVHSSKMKILIYNF